jgi:hypothetical protein
VTAATGTVLQNIVSTSVAVSVSASNNQALVAYSSDVYALATTVSYVSTACGVLGLILGIVALIGGKIVGL